MTTTSAKPIKRLFSLKKILCLFAAYSCFVRVFVVAFCQTLPSVELPNAVATYFNQLTTADDVMSSKNYAAYEKLAASIEGSTPTDVAAVISVIDQQLDRTKETQNPLAKKQAVYLLQIISGRTDGPELLSTEIGHLQSMLNDPSHSLSEIALLTLYKVGQRRPDLVVPILERALQASEVNNATGVGPAVAGALLKVARQNKDVADDLVHYMQRDDLTDVQLILTIVSIDTLHSIPDAITAELARCLDRPNDRVKIRALIGIAGHSSETGKALARARIYTLTNDTHESPQVRRIAAQALVGKITENPESAQ